MKILFIHQNFPAQFKHLAPNLARQGHEVKALAIEGKAVPGVEVRNYKLARGNTPGIHRWSAEFETKAIRGEACAHAMVALRDEGFYPQVVVAHPGWGEALFVKDVFPDSKLLTFNEFYYSSRGSDVGFDPEFARNGWEEDARLRTKNNHLLLALEAADWGLAPTWWQRHSLPGAFRDRVSVIFDGIDTDTVRPDPEAKLELPDGTVLQAGDEVITFVNRNLEPYRGYHVFMRALPEILRQRPNAQVLIVGGDKVSYGAKPPAGQSWKEIFLSEVREQLDLSRVHFIGHIPYPTFLRMLQVSACHVYLTYPFVLSWSCIESLSTGCLVVGSRTQPVEEVIEHGKNGLLVDFFDIEGISRTVVDALANRERYVHLRQAARETARQRYDLKRVCLPQQLALIEALGRGALPLA